MSGTAAFYDGMLQMVHPDHVVSEADVAKLPLIEPVYPLTEGLGLERRAQGGRSGARPRAGVARMAGRRVAAAAGLAGVSATALAALHHPDDLGAVDARNRRPGRGSPMTNCLPGQLALALVRANQKRLAGRPSRGDGRIAEEDHRGAALLAHALAGARGRGDQRRPRASPSACCACCRAMSARARPWWRCSPPRP